MMNVDDEIVQYSALESTGKKAEEMHELGSNTTALTAGAPPGNKYSKKYLSLLKFVRYLLP